MTLPEFSVRRPVATSCVIIGLTLLGINAFRKMGLELIPQVDVPYVTVVTVYPGASPEELELDVAKRIEDTVSSIEGLKHVSSVCMENVCQTLLEFELNVDVDIAATDVREKIDLIRSDLPEDVEDPIIQKFDINARPIATLALKGTLPVEDLYDYADNELRDRLTVVQGVANVDLIGGAEREVHVELDREKLAARGLSTMDVIEAVRSGVRTIPAGRVQEGGIEYSVKFDADYRSLAQMADLEVANHEGKRCYLRDVGRVLMSTEEVRQAAQLDGTPCVSLRVVKKAEANAVQVVRNLRQAVERINQELPATMELVWLQDDGTFIEAMNQDAWWNVVVGILLTAGILFLFLYELRALVIVSITMPLTIVISLFFIHAIGYTLNAATLIAIGLSVGILVTNSIVVLEAIIARLHKTGNPEESARLGASEVFLAVLASALTNIVVLFPLGAMPTRVGLFMGPLAWTMVIMTAVSLGISFTLTPMLASLMLRPSPPQSHSPLRRMQRGFDSVLNRIIEGYRRILWLMERHRWAAGGLILLILAMMGHAVWLAGQLGTGTMPDSDQGNVYVRLEFPTRYDLKNTIERVQEAERRLRDVPELKHILTLVGRAEAILGQTSEGVYLAQLLLVFSQRTERDLTIYDLMDDITRRIDPFPDATVLVSIPAPIGGQSNPVEMEIAGLDLKELDRLALSGLEVAKKIPGFLTPDTTVRPPKPELRVRPRREILADLQTPAVGMGLTLRGNIEGIKAATYKSRETARNYDIVVKLIEHEGKDQVANFAFPGAEGHALVLAALGHVSEEPTPIQIIRKDKERISKLTSQLAPTLPLGKAVQLISQQLDTEVPFPPGYHYQFAGMYELLSEGLGGLLEAGIIALLLVFLSLAGLIESFRRTFLVLVTIPLALIGTTWALALAGISFELFVIASIVMMIGIVVNNAILIINRFDVLLEEGMPRHEAMIQAACDEFRPVVMITLAAVLGMIPLAIGQGIGAESRVGVGVATIGGILVSGILTQLLLPVLYDLATRRSISPSHPSSDGK